MNINTDALVSMTEANQNFSKVAWLVDKKGMASDDADIYYLYLLQY